MYIFWQVNHSYNKVYTEMAAVTDGDGDTTATQSQADAAAADSIELKEKKGRQRISSGFNMTNLIYLHCS